MRTFILMALFIILTACSTTEESPDESNQKIEDTEEGTEDKSTEAEATSDEDQDESNTNSEENETTEEETASNESEDIEIEISLESVLEEEQGTMINASRQEIEDELTSFIEDNNGDVTDEMVYEKLLEMLGGHPDMQEGIKYFQDFSAELVDLTDQPGGLKVEDGELSLRNNVYILMDNSGSMADEIDGQTKMDAARMM